MSAQPPAPPNDLLRPPTQGQDMTRVPAPGQEGSAKASAPASPRFSFRGWSLAVWATKNADVVKSSLSMASAATAGVTVSDLASLRNVALIWGLAVAAIGSRALADAVHYFLREDPS